MRRNRRRGTGPLDRMRGALRAAARLAVPALVVAAAVTAARSAADHSYFRVRAVAVEGARDPEAVVRWSGVAPGASLWSIDPWRVELRLASQPRIRSASVRREFPDRLRIVVEERLPVGVILLDAPLFVDAEGQVFPPLGRELLDDRPYVSGIRAADLERRPAWATSRLRGAARILRLWQRRPDWPAVSEVRLEPGGDFLVYPEGPPMAVRFGPDVGDDAFARLAAVLDLWRGREAQVAAVDLRVPGQAVLRVRGSAPGAQQRVRI